MFIAIKTALAMIRKKKAQNIMIGIIIMLISTLLYVGISMISQSSPFDEMFKRADATESLLIIPKIGDNADRASDWYSEQSQVEAVLAYEVFMVDIDYNADDKPKTETVFITEFLPDSDYDILYHDGKTVASAPVGNEMLINYNFAKGRNIEVDDLFIYMQDGKEYEFKIAGIVVDPQFSTPFITPNRCFVESGFFKKNDIVNEMVILGIKYYDIENLDDNAMFQEFNKEHGAGINPIFIDYKTIQVSYNMIMGIISAILIAVSLLILIIVIFVIRSTVQNMILQQYRQIGVKKAIGYTNNQIRNSMFIVYCMIGFIASTIGAFAGLPIRRAVNAGVSSDLQVGLDAPMDIYMIITIIAVVALIFLFSWIATQKITKVKPVQAIKYGMPERKVSTNSFSIAGTKKRPLSVLLAIKQSLSNKKKTVTTALLITLLVYVALVLGNVGTTLADSKHFASHLFGMRIGDYTIAVDETHTLNETIKKIETQEDVENVVFFQISLSESFTLPDGNTQAIGGIVIYGDVPDDFIILTSGRHPAGSNEIVVSSEVETVSGKSVGDYISINSETEDKICLITGICNTVSNNGHAYIMINKDEPDSKFSTEGFYWVYTSGDVIIAETEKEIKDLLGNDAKVSRFDTNVTNVVSTLEAFPMVITLLLTVFLIVGGIIILNSTIMDINNSTKVYGIMKATGFSNAFITRVLVIKVLILTTMGVVVGFALNMLTMDALMRGVFSLTPFFTIELPVLFDVAKSIMIVTLFFIVSVIATLIPSRKIGKVSPKQLIAE